MTIGIANDHRAYETKEKLKELLDDYNIIDYGCYSNERTDYPKYALRLGKAVIDNEVDLGVVMCGTGIGVSIACNKVKGIRAARVVNKDDAFKAKNHNGANIITFGANLDINIAKEIIDTFINTKDPNEERHLRRVNKIIAYENGEL